MGKINIAEILKDCPSGMELDCTMWDNVTFAFVSDDNYYPITIRTPDGQVSLNRCGCYSNSKHSKCVLFPKGKTTWEGFVPPYEFKDGDVGACETKDGCVQLFLIKGCNTDERTRTYCFLDINGDLDIDEYSYIIDRLATEEEKAKLFQAIKDNGYRWNADTKNLERLTKFKIGDRIRLKDSTTNFISTVTKINEDGSIAVNDCSFAIKYELQDNWELVPTKFDVTTLKPFDKVLVRDTNEDYWKINMFGYIGTYDRQYFMCIANSGFYQCIPYEGNEHLLGTTDDCDEYYKTW